MPLLQIIPDIFEAVKCDWSTQKDCPSTTLIELLISVSHFLLAVNSASNFFIYMLRGDKFRQTFVQMFVRGEITQESRRERRRYVSTRSVINYNDHQ